MPTLYSISSGAKRKYVLFRFSARAASGSPPCPGLIKTRKAPRCYRNVFLVEVTTKRLREIAGLIDRGELKTRVGAVLPLAGARDAHLMLEGRLTPPKGKIILDVQSVSKVIATD
jgi:NADPH:quinone reductase-like Zn-dependent oxidoreductase